MHCTVRLKSFAFSCNKEIHLFKILLREIQTNQGVLFKVQTNQGVLFKVSTFLSICISFKTEVGVTKRILEAWLNMLAFKSGNFKCSHVF